MKDNKVLFIPEFGDTITKVLKRKEFSAKWFTTAELTTACGLPVSRSRSVRLGHYLTRLSGVKKRDGASAKLYLVTGK
jgi:hypothetical protein